MLPADSDASLALRGDGTMGREVVPDFVTKRPATPRTDREPTENVDDDDVDAMIPG